MARPLQHRGCAATARARGCGWRTIWRMDPLEQAGESLDPLPQVEFAMLADAVQAVGGKLFVLGGGWDTLWVRQFPARHPTLGIGIRLRIPWSFAEEKFVLAVDLVDEDGKSLFQGRKLAQPIRFRRPPGLPVGGDVGLVRAFTFSNLPLVKPGGYAFRILVDDQEVSRLRFWARTRRSATESGNAGEADESD